MKKKIISQLPYTVACDREIKLVAVSIGCAVHFRRLRTSRAVARSFDAPFGRALVDNVVRWYLSMVQGRDPHVVVLSVWQGANIVGRSRCHACLVFRLDALCAFASPVASASSRTSRFFSTKSGPDILRTHFRLVDMTQRGRGNASSYFSFHLCMSSERGLSKKKKIEGPDNVDDPETEVAKEISGNSSPNNAEQQMKCMLATVRAYITNLIFCLIGHDNNLHLICDNCYELFFLVLISFSPSFVHLLAIV
ncbi:hypothetical protein T11_4821 [Trichinella zimbabwensis]|uniref:Uncharacterized protein n=1 Tax=Trichinella zimbabwensis TaxID=268475 RepID=A0A0V1HMY0_9BILA|nr:hypothetical protein T11_4821 [Trichinella zimbabwensis]